MDRLPFDLVYTDDDQSWLLAKTKPKNGHYECKSLRGKIGQRVRCTVYDSRPLTCRAFMPGSEPCLETRRGFGIGDQSNVGGEDKPA